MALPFWLRIASYFGVLAIMLFFEWLAPFATSEQEKPHRVVFHLGLGIGNAVILYAMSGWAIIGATLYTHNHKWGLAHVIGLAGGAEILATVIIFDLWDYWMHLANHRVPLLWRFHKAHHSDMDVDVTTASRFHVGELIISSSIKCLVIFAWGPSFWGLAVFETLLTGSSQFHHSNVNLPFRWQDRIEKIIVTPRMHRCHHALHRNCFDTNFSTIFSFWDRLFRSYHRVLGTVELELIGLYQPRGSATMNIKSFLKTPFA
jgi:sterol desaturase/sphingolipid hydroxylase (fatty acid hydroxylase superfamily)